MLLARCHMDGLDRSPGYKVPYKVAADVNVLVARRICWVICGVYRSLLVLMDVHRTGILLSAVKLSGRRVRIVPP